MSDNVHRWTLPESLGGAVMGVRELTVDEYEDLLKQASKKIKDDDVQQGAIGALLTTLQAAQKKLLRISCLVYLGEETAFQHEGGPQGLAEGLSYRQVQYLDRAIDTLHELTVAETKAFDQSHCLPGAVAKSPKSVPAKSGNGPSG